MLGGKEVCNCSQVFWKGEIIPFLIALILKSYSYYPCVYVCDGVVINTLPWTRCLFDIVSDIESGGR